MKFFNHLLFGVLLLTAITSRAQLYDTTQYYGKMNYVFDHVDKNQISTGFLRDYGIEFLNLDNYTGAVLHDSNFVALDEWRMLYASLYSSQINSNASMLYLDTVNRLINKWNYTSMPTTFACLYYNYNKFKDNAVTSNLMSVSGDQLYDVPGRPESPYEAKELFAIAPIRQAALTGSNQFIFRPELFTGNTGKTISSIAYDASGGNNYQTIAFNTAFAVSYDSAGFYNFNIRITYTDNSTRYGHTKIVVYQNPDSLGARYGTGFTPATNEPVVATKAYLNELAEGDITIDLAASNATGQIRKPLIVVEGFDPNGSFGFNTGGDLIDRINFDINTGGTITLNQGLDDINQYDLIFLNFNNTTDYIQRNAYLLERVIEIVNTRKTTWNGVRQDNVIIGMSMGGLVARFALRDMELNSEDHETRLFISHDAPHWGANIPVGAQAAVQHLAPWQIANVGGAFPWIRWVDMFPMAVDALDVFNSPAAAQMLIQRYTLSGQTLTADNSAHTSFLNEINQMGWPVNCKNLTLANGACNGSKVFNDNNTIFTIDGQRGMTYFGSLWRSFIMTITGGTGNFIGLVNGWGNPQFNSWGLLWQFPLSLFSTSSSVGVDFKVRAVPASGTQEIYRGDVYSKKKILWLIDVKNYFIKCHVSSNTGMLPLDNAPGGLYDLNQFGIDPTEIENQLPDFFNGFVEASTLEPRFCFIPTVSSLAISNPAANLSSNICANINCLNAGGVQHFFAPQQNELHISYTQASADWILQWEDPAFDCPKICQSNLSISGPAQVCDVETYTVPQYTNATYTWSVNNSFVVTLSPNGNSAQLTRKPGRSGKVVLTVQIDNGTCGTYIVTKTVQIGSYAPYIIGPYDPVEHTIMGVACMGEQYYFIGSVPDNPSGQYPYTWTLFPPPGSNDFPSLYSGSPVYLTFSEMGNYTLRLAITDNCGTSFVDRIINVQECFGLRIAVSPNPTTEEAIVTVEDESEDEKVSGNNENIKMELFNFNTGVKHKQWSFNNRQKQFALNLKGISKGLYVLKVTKGNRQQSAKVIIE